MSAVTFTTKRYPDLTEILCTAPSALCPAEANIIAIISRSPGTKWIVNAPMFGRAVFKTRAEAECHVRSLIGEA